MFLQLVCTWIAPASSFWVNTLVGLYAIFLFIILGKFLQETLESGQGLRYFNFCENILKPLFHGFHWPHWNKFIDNGHNYYKNLYLHFWDVGGIVIRPALSWLYANHSWLLLSLGTYLTSGLCFCEKNNVHHPPGGHGPASELTWSSVLTWLSGGHLSVGAICTGRWNPWYHHPS